MPTRCIGASINSCCRLHAGPPLSHSRISAGTLGAIDMRTRSDHVSYHRRSVAVEDAQIFAKDTMARERARSRHSLVQHPGDGSVRGILDKYNPQNGFPFDHQAQQTTVFRVARLWVQDAHARAAFRRSSTGPRKISARATPHCNDEALDFWRRWRLPRSPPPTASGVTNPDVFNGAGVSFADAAGGVLGRRPARPSCGQSSAPISGTSCDSKDKACQGQGFVSLDRDGGAALSLRASSRSVQGASATRPKTSILRTGGSDRRELAPFTAGGHIDLHLSNGMIRSYSLVNDQRERHRYVIAVNKDAAGRRRFQLRSRQHQGRNIITVPSAEHFALHEEAEHSVLRGRDRHHASIVDGPALETFGAFLGALLCRKDARCCPFLDELDALRPNVHLNLRVRFCDERRGGGVRPRGHREEGARARTLYCCARCGCSRVRGGDGRSSRRSCACRIFQPGQRRAIEGGFEVKLARRIAGYWSTPARRS